MHSSALPSMINRWNYDQEIRLTYEYGQKTSTA